MSKINLPKEKTTVYYANPLKRTAAFILDLIIIDFVVISSFAPFFRNIVPKTTTFDKAYAYLQIHPELISKAYSAMVVMSFLMILYFAYFEYKFKQTPGKMLFHIFVESKNKDLTFMQCVLRSVYLIPVFPVFLIMIIDPILMIIKSERLSEIFSKTKTMEVYTL